MLWRGMREFAFRHAYVTGEDFPKLSKPLDFFKIFQGFASPHSEHNKSPAQGGAFVMARHEGFEPPTYWFVARHSIRLS